MGSKEEIKIDDDFILIRFQNDTDKASTFQRPVTLGLIQFHFGLKGSAKFIFNNGNYTLDFRNTTLSVHHTHPLCRRLRTPQGPHQLHPSTLIMQVQNHHHRPCPQGHHQQLTY